MNKEKFINLVENYDSQDEILVSKMALLIEKYPYFQLPRFFYTKALKDQNKNDLDLALNQLALHTADRGVLKKSMETKFVTPKKMDKVPVDNEVTIKDSETKKVKSSTQSTNEIKSIVQKKEHLIVKTGGELKEKDSSAIQSTSKKIFEKNSTKKNRISTQETLSYFNG